MTQGIKVTALDDITQTASDDIMYVVDGTDTISKKVELQNLLYDNMVTPAKLSTGAPNWNIDSTLTIGGGLFTGGESVEINYWGSGDRNAYIDFHSQGEVGDSGYDYDARLFRHPGVNGKLELSNRGTGPITVDREIADITDAKSIVTKEYVDTQVSALNNTVSISTCGLSYTTGLFTTPTVNEFTTANFVYGVNESTHILTRDESDISKMNAPSGGSSILSVNFIITDADEDTNDDYIATLYIDDIMVAKDATNTSTTDTTYRMLSYNSYVAPSAVIRLEVTRLSFAETTSVVGSMNCVNYQ